MDSRLLTRPSEALPLLEKPLEPHAEVVGRRAAVTRNATSSSVSSSDRGISTPFMGFSSTLQHRSTAPVGPGPAHRHRLSDGRATAEEVLHRGKGTTGVAIKFNG